MRLPYGFLLVYLSTVSLFSSYATSQQPHAKVCVAAVNNRTTELLSPDRMTSRLVKAVTDKKLSAVAMDSASADAGELKPTLENSEEMKEKECGYIVLTRITGSSRYAGPPSEGGISIGQARIPSIDASDGGSRPVYRNQLEINFAIFRAGNPFPLLDTQLLDRARWNASDSLMEAMDREGNRVRHELNKK